MTDQSITLIGDGIENPGNAVAMIHAAQMFGVACSFRDTKKLATSPEFASPQGEILPLVTTEQIRDRHAQIIAFDNLPGAKTVYGFRPGSDCAVVVGNEQRGLSHQVRELATDALQIPMQSREINCLNVAAASAVALYYLRIPRGQPVGTNRNPTRHRPELLFMGAGNHVELGSALRSATAFGWGRAFIEDRDRVWFGVDRAIRSEGRAAARRARNRIRLIPSSASTDHASPEVVVVSVKPVGIPIHKVNLARGSRQLIVIPDESRVDLEREDWVRKGKAVRIAHLEIPNTPYAYHYRLAATLALAEIARQVGMRTPIRGERPAGLKYSRELEPQEASQGEVVSLAELMHY